MATDTTINLDKIPSTLFDWLIDKSKDKPAGEKYSYSEVALLVYEYSISQSQPIP